MAIYSLPAMEIELSKYEFCHQTGKAGCMTRCFGCLLDALQRKALNVQNSNPDENKQTIITSYNAIKGDFE